MIEKGGGAHPPRARLGVVSGPTVIPVNPRRRCSPFAPSFSSLRPSPVIDTGRIALSGSPWSRPTGKRLSPSRPRFAIAPPLVARSPGISVSPAIGAYDMSETVQIARHDRRIRGLSDKKTLMLKRTGRREGDLLGISNPLLFRPIIVLARGKILR